MKKILLICFFATFSTAFSQGFDWQYDIRLPFSIPNLYMGLDSKFKQTVNYGDMPVFEGSENCCNYENGSGTALNLAASIEYWQDDYVYLINAEVNLATNSFTKQTSLPRKVDANSSPVLWTTEYQLEYKSFDIILSGGIKYPVFEHLYINGLMNLELNLSNEFELKERVVSPDYIPFEDGTLERTLINAKAPDRSFVQIYPSVLISYDLDMGLGKYLSPYLGISQTLYSKSNNSDWGQSTYLFGLKFLYAWKRIE